MKASRDMAGVKRAKPEVAFEDLWDWAYCPLRVWWRRRGVDGGEARRTGEQLMRRAIQAAFGTYYRLLRKDRIDDLSPVKALGLVWKAWLQSWGLDGTLARDLVEYQEGRRAILRRFEEGGDIRRPDGTLYQRPMWTRWWQELASASGLLELRRNIDELGPRVGLWESDPSSNRGARSAMGLADAFATSFDALKAQKDLPPADKVIGVYASLSIELLSLLLRCQAAVVVDLGQAGARGRPRKGSAGPRKKRKLGYELHLFDRDPPNPYALSRDLRVLALGQALPEDLDLDADEAVVDRVFVRHVHSGEVQPLRPDLSAGADLLEALARSFLMGARSGAYAPRMVCGWRACGDCEYRSMCFADSGVMAAFNPPMAAQIRASQRMYEQVSKFLEEGEGCRSATEALRAFLTWMAREPGLSPEGALWLIDAVEAGGM